MGGGGRALDFVMVGMGGGCGSCFSSVDMGATRNMVRKKNQKKNTSLVETSGLKAKNFFSSHKISSSFIYFISIEPRPTKT